MSKAPSPRPFLERYRFWALTALTTALILLLAGLAPEQLPVLQYKLTLPALGALDFYWLDRALFPFAQPDSYLDEDWMTSAGDRPGDADYPVAKGYMPAFITAQARQAGMVCIGALSVALGL